MRPFEIIIFACRSAAEAAGFKGSTIPGHPEFMAWWPQLGPQPLHTMRPPSRVTIAAEVRLPEQAEHCLRARMRPTAIWMDLR